MTHPLNLEHNTKKTKYMKYIFTSLLCAFLICFSFVQCSSSDEDVPLPPGQDSIIPDTGIDLYGRIKDTNGNNIQGVVVSDGYSCTITNEAGIYQLTRHENAQFVFYSTPSDYAITKEGPLQNNAYFYRKLSGKGAIRKDFILTKLSQPENEFNLICIADPQADYDSHLERFKNETIADVNKYLSSTEKKCYGVALGDITGDLDDRPVDLPDRMKDLLGSTTMTMFTIVGNHDKAPEEGLSVRGGSYFSSLFGPLNYSFNRGKVHVICLDNILFSGTDRGDYNTELTNDQIEWVKQDLSYVPKDYMIIVCQHSPVYNMNNKVELFELLKGFSEVHLMAGHTHDHRNITHSPYGYYEHVTGTSCGLWWRSNICGDGTPNGYAIYEIEGNKMKNWYYKATNYDKNFQIRLHRGNERFGGVYGSFDYGQNQNTLIANIWNSDSQWTVNVYENGVKTGSMIRLSSVDRDAWSKGYHIGELGQSINIANTYNSHLYAYSIRNQNAKIRVEAIDRFGNIYESEAIISDFCSAYSYECY